MSLEKKKEGEEGEKGERKESLIDNYIYIMKGVCMCVFDEVPTEISVCLCVCVCVCVCGCGSELGMGG